MTDKIYSVDLKTLQEPLPAVYVLTAVNTKINQETNTLKVTVGDTEVEINTESISELIAVHEPKESILLPTDVEDVLLKLRGEIARLASEKTTFTGKHVAVSEPEAIRILALVIQHYHPELLEYNHDKCTYKYSIEVGAWIMHAAVDFTVLDKEIKAGTIGGRVENPYRVRNSWVEEGCKVEGAYSVIENSYVGNKSRVSNSYLKDTEVKDSLVFDSCLYKTSILGNSCVDRITAAVFATSNASLYNLLAWHYTPICGFKAVGDKENPLVLSHYRGIRYLPVVAIGVGTEDELMTVGRGARNWDISINRGCFHGNLAAFKARIDEDIDRSALESEKYYAMVEYLALKVDEKRSDYLKPAMQELLKVYDAWLVLVNYNPVYPVCLLPYINLGNKVDKNVSGIFKDLIGVEE
nr:MAG TPA: hypothetical protein [Caudoviricetes sp.]